MRLISISLLLVFAANSASGSDRDRTAFERILLPVYFDSVRRGAFGSLWVTDFIARNQANVTVQVFNSECVFFCECVGITCVVAGTPPGGVFLATSPRSDQNESNPGYFLYVSRATADLLPMQLRVRDISRSTTSFGTEIPVVRERELRSSTIYLLNIPIDNQFREHLRVYGIGRLSDEFTVRIRIIDEMTNELLTDLPVRLVPGLIERGHPTKDDFPTHPAYAEVASLKDVLAGRAVQKVRIEVVPTSGGVTFWAFVAITNNETQHLTLVTPQ